jgi:hypothetical protein
MLHLAPLAVIPARVCAQIHMHMRAPLVASHVYSIARDRLQPFVFASLAKSLQMLSKVSKGYIKVIT